MSEWGIGYAIGMMTGLAIGLITARRRQPWATLNNKEKKMRIGIITAICILVIAGVLCFFLV